MVDVAVFGDFCVDVLVYIDRLPSFDQSFVARDIKLSFGGVGGNVSCALSKLGLSVKALGCVGDDFFGKIYLDDLIKNGVDVRSVRRLKGLGTCTVVIHINPEGSRAIIGFRGANSLCDLSIDDLGISEGLKHLHISGYMLLNRTKVSSYIDVLSKVKELGISTSVDLEGIAFSDSDVIKELKGVVDYVFLNREEAVSIVKSKTFNKDVAISLYRALKPRALVIKLGAMGCLLVKEGSSLVPIKSFKVKAVDTTGAGDAFNAGFIYGVIKGLPLSEAALLGNALGAYKCMGYGARHYPTLSELVSTFPQIRPIINKIK